MLTKAFATELAKSGVRMSALLQARFYRLMAVTPPSEAR